MGDPAPSVDDLSLQVYSDFADTMVDVVKSNPVCEGCGLHPSVRINRWGPVKAYCDECLKAEQSRFDQHAREQEELGKLYGWE